MYIYHFMNKLALDQGITRLWWTILRRIWSCVQTRPGRAASAATGSTVHARVYVYHSGKFVRKI